MLVARRGLPFLTVLALSSAWMPEAHAGKVFNITESVNAQVFNPCEPAEPVFFSGTRRLTLFVTETKNTLHLHGQSSSQGLSGTGLITGDRYTVVGVDGFHLTSAKGTTQTINTRLRLIRHGPGDNMVANALMHITVNANGEVMAETDIFTIECHG